MKIQYKLPQKLRSELKKPLGKLIRNEEIPEILSKLNGILITIGDICTLKALDAGKLPDLAIIDFKTLRKYVDEHLQILKRIPRHYKRIKVGNPPGTLTKELLYVIKRALNGGERTLIIVEGEEDLAALPAILYAPSGSWVMYGQPGEGAVFIKVDDMVKKTCEDILKKMEVDDRGDNH